MIVLNIKNRRYRNFIYWYFHIKKSHSINWDNHVNIIAQNVLEDINNSKIDKKNSILQLIKIEKDYVKEFGIKEINSRSDSYIKL